MGWALKNLSIDSRERIARSLFKVENVDGDWLNGLCPFHDDKMPSFGYNRADDVFFCHASCTAFYLRSDVVPIRYEEFQFPTLDEHGNPFMEFRAKLDAGGNHIMQDHTLNDGTVIQIPAMEKAQAVHTEQHPVYDPLPCGYVDVSKEEHSELFFTQTMGMVIQTDPNGTGRPVALPVTPPTHDELLQYRSSAVREERDRRISSTDYLMAVDYPLSEEARAAVAAYRQALRDLPQQEGFPWSGGEADDKECPWPVQPAYTRIASTYPRNTEFIRD